jgi:transforming growth factor-beta-induced protein
MKTNIFKTALLSLSFSALLIVSCTKEDEKKPTPTTPALKSIFEIANSDTSFSILVAAINKTGLKATLSNAGTFTVFAPNNAAFRSEDLTEAIINAITEESDILALKVGLLYHVLGSKVKSTDITNTYVPTLFTVSGNGVSLRTSINPIKLNNETNVVAANIEASNGIVHVIDQLLEPQSVVGIALNNPAFTTLVSALVKADLVETLEDLTTATVFAPTNQAFTAINFDLEKNTKEGLTPLLISHVLASQVRSSQITNGLVAKTLNTMVDLTFNTTAGVKFSGGSTTDISVTTADIQATNGVVHVIDKVILDVR